MRPLTEVAKDIAPSIGAATGAFSATLSSTSIAIATGLAHTTYVTTASATAVGVLGKIALGAIGFASIPTAIVSVPVAVSAGLAASGAILGYAAVKGAIKCFK